MIKVRGLSLNLGEFRLRDVSLDIARQEYFVVLGPTGAGKTLLIESIAGLLHPQKGEIWIDGREVTSLRPENRQVGYLPQDYALFPHLSMKANIAFGMKIRKAPAQAIEKKVAELADLLGITHLLEREVLHLSGGERQRAALARALAIEPSVLLLDEPLSALDEQTRENLCRELRRVHETCGITTIHISHSFEETLALADRIAILNAGQVQQVGAPTEVMSRPASEFVAAFVRCQNVLPGRAHREGELTCVKMDGAEIYSEAATTGEVTAVVRPEDIAISLLPPEKKRNVFQAQVRFLIDRGALLRVDLAVQAQICAAGNRPAQAEFIALCARSQGKSLALALGQQVYLSFEPGAVHLIAR